MRKANRVDWVDYAKGIGIVLVVFGHVWRGMAGDGMFDWPFAVPFVDQWVYAFHMPLFFFLSGLFAGGSVKHSPQTFLVKRLKGVAYPYFVWILIVGGIRSLVYDGPDTFIDFLVNYWKVLYDPYDIFWFLYALFLISVVFYLLRRAGLSTAVVMLLFLASNLGFAFTSGDFAWRPANYFCLYGVYFAFGAFFAEVKWGVTLGKLSNYTKVGLSFILLGIVASLAWSGLLVSGKPILIAAGAGTLAVVLLAQILEDWGSADFIRWWGTLSLQIYVAHTIVGAAIRLALVAVGITDVSIHLIAGVTFGMYVPILIYVSGNKLGFPYLFSLKR